MEKINTITDLDGFVDICGETIMSKFGGAIMGSGYCDGSTLHQEEIKNYQDWCVQEEQSKKQGRDTAPSNAFASK